ncbi:MAG: DEAD/DEAH box helicase [Bacteroidia bacterium]
MKIQREILDKLKIEALNPMQEAALEAIAEKDEVILISPTGTGKTLAFLLPIIAELDPNEKGLQLLILAPSRELAIQIEQVAREMGSGYKINAAYGGRKVSKDKLELTHTPSILVGTPGRIADHIRRGTFESESVKYLVLDEFDKSLEIGFEKEMQEIVEALPGLKKKVLTSATFGVKVPRFVGLDNPQYLDFANSGKAKLTVKVIYSPTKDKLQMLGAALRHLGDQSGIVFCSFRDSVRRVSEYLHQQDIAHSCFSGGMEQRDRERSLIKFRNGTHQILLATDLAARGIDVPELDYIIHYHLPLKAEEFTHRNGRTARMNQEGAAYILHYSQDVLPPFVGKVNEEKLRPGSVKMYSDWQTLFVSGGRKDKISKGDIAGLFFKQGQLKPDQLGLIELKTDCAFVAVKSEEIHKLIEIVDQKRLKNKKVRVSLV